MMSDKDLKFRNLEEIDKQDFSFSAKKKQLLQLFCLFFPNCTCLYFNWQRFGFLYRVV